MSGKVVGNFDNSIIGHIFIFCQIDKWSMEELSLVLILCISELI
jgi:hypothetical protein